MPRRVLHPLIELKIKSQQRRELIAEDVQSVLRLGNDLGLKIGGREWNVEIRSGLVKHIAVMDIALRPAIDNLQPALSDLHRILDAPPRWIDLHRRHQRVAP